MTINLRCDQSSILIYFKVRSLKIVDFAVYIDGQLQSKNEVEQHIAVFEK